MCIWGTRNPQIHSKLLIFEFRMQYHSHMHMNCKGFIERAMWGTLESKMVWKNLNLCCFVQVFPVYLRIITIYKGGWWGWGAGSYFARLFFENKNYMTKHSSEAAEIPKNNDFCMKTDVLFDFDCFFQ